MRFFFVCILFFLAFFVGHAQAQDYTVRDLAVDASGESAIDAREKALIQARTNAFKVLAERLLGAEKSQAVQPPSESALTTMVDSFEINREKTAKNRYLASMNVTFNQRAVQGYLSRYGQLSAGTDTAVGVTQPSAQDPAYSAYKNTNPYDQAYTGGGSLSKEDANLTQSILQIDFSSMSQWKDLQNRLYSLQLVRGLTINSMSTRGAIVTLSHFGTVNQLQAQLISRGMKLYNNTKERQVIAPYVLMIAG